MLALGVPLLVQHVGRADEPAEPLVRAIKATYLVKLPPFVEWPHSASRQVFNLCVVGADPIGALVTRAAQGQTIDGVPIRVEEYQTVSGPGDCQLMYIGASDPQTVLRQLRGVPVLTVTDGQRDPSERGIINFIIVDNHVRFDIDDSAAAANGLVISSKLLGIAASVRPRAKR